LWISCNDKSIVD